MRKSASGIVQVVSANVDLNVVQRLEELARLHGRNRSAEVRAALQAHVDKHEEPALPGGEGAEWLVAAGGS